MKMKIIGIALALLASDLKLQADENILEIAHMLSLSGERKILDYAHPSGIVKDNPDCPQEAPQAIALPRLPVPATDNTPFKVTPTVAFELNSVTGLGSQQQEKKLLSYKDEDFENKWSALVQPQDDESRKKVMKQICSDMDQEKAIRFAGYMGRQNFDIYDDTRSLKAEDGISERQEENLSMDDYYEAHRNYHYHSQTNWENYNGTDEVRRGICGDAAKMIAEFLSQCHFSCQDIDVLSYRTATGGHAIVAARGSGGEYYTANWHWLEKSPQHSNVNAPGSTSIEADPSSQPRHSPVINRYDCNGNSKGSSVTPLGTLLMMAHEDSQTLNFGNDYHEVAMVIEELGGVDEAKLKVFKGKGVDGQKVMGAALRVEHMFGDPSDRIYLEGEGSLLFAQADRPVVSEGRRSQLDQKILSPYLNTRLNVNAYQGERLNVGGVAQVSSAGFLMMGKDSTKGYSMYVIDYDENGEVVRPDETNQLSEEKEATFNATHLTRTSVALNSEYKTPDSRIAGQVGVGQSLEMNRNQQGSNRHLTLVQDQLFANASFEYISSKDNMTQVEVNYNNRYLLRQSTLSVEAMQRISNTEISTGVTIIKNPGQATVRALNLAMAQGFEVRDNYVEAGVGAQYLIIENAPNQAMLNITAAYRF